MRYMLSEIVPLFDEDTTMTYLFGETTNACQHLVKEFDFKKAAIKFAESNYKIASRDSDDEDAYEILTESGKHYVIEPIE